MSPSRPSISATSPLLLANIGQLLTLRHGTRGPRRGSALADLAIIEDASVLVVSGKIVSVGKTRDALRDAWIKSNRRNLTEIDCDGKVVLPGFVDSHTHPAFVGPRLVDFEQRLAGATYEEIARAGGGIRSSVEAVRRATRSALARDILSRVNKMAAHGTTTVEAKSGYGLSLKDEIKSLEAIREAAGKWPGTVVSTLLGAHVVPKEFVAREKEYLRLVCEEMIPRAAKRELAKFVDVFCERGAFSASDVQQIFESAEKSGLAVRAHIGQLSQTALAPFLRFHPASFDHLDYISDDDIAQLAKHDTIATLVPGANYFLNTDRYPSARKLIDSGVPVALASDYNPGSSPTCSMQFVLSLACTHMRMSPAEAIAAATINGAYALRLEAAKGSIDAGKDADLAVFDVSDYREIAYWFGSNLCSMTLLSGIRQTREA